MGEVSFICKRTVISTKPVEPGKFNPLSVLDRIMERNHLRLVFYYNLPTRRRPGELTKKLRETISEMLSSFPVVLGRLVRTPEGKWTIKCNDAGVRMVEAKVNGSVEEWLKNVDREKELMLIHWEEMFHKPYFWSTFYVQITEFECGGVAIGLSCTHMLSDPISATMLVRAWAETTLKGQIAAPPLFLPLPSTLQLNNDDRPDYSNLNSMISHYKSAIQSSPPIPPPNPKQSTIAFHFNREAVKSCIAMAGAARRSCSPFEALAALFWTRISKIKAAEAGLVEISLFLDARSALGLDNSFFGNCMVFKKVEVRPGPNGVPEAAAMIGETASRMDGGDVAELIEWLEREAKCDDPPRMNGGDLICVNLENVGAYSAVFEEKAAPLRVSYYVEPAVGAGQLIVLPAVEPEGRVVAVTVEEEEGRKLLEDPVIQQFSPTVVMGLKEEEEEEEEDLKIRRKIIK